jgi:hypothetical protein
MIKKRTRPQPRIRQSSLGLEEKSDHEEITADNEDKIE